MSNVSQSGAPALGGYDAVAYFKLGKPVPGGAEHSVDYGGATWLFSSGSHANDFEAEPDRYIPAYRGHCAFAASLGKTETGDPTRWAVRNGRLFLNSNHIAHLLWKVIPGRVKAADRHWSSGQVGVGV